MDDLAMADFAFEAFGSTTGEMFKNAGLALESVIVDLDSVGGETRPRETRRVSLSTRRVEELAGLETLLFDFLSELVYLQSAEGLVFSDFDIKIKENGGWKLDAICSGEKLDPERHKLGTEVKGVTMHEFEVGKADGGWRAQVVFDV